MNEALKKALEALDSKLLTESVQTQITEAFDNAVEAKVKSEVEAIKESFDTNLNAVVDSKLEDIKTKFNESVEAKAKELFDEDNKKIVESVDLYLNEVKEAWLKENKVDVQNEADVAKAEKIMEAAAEFAKSFGIKLDEITKTDYDSKELLDKALKEKADLKVEVLGLKKAAIMEEVSKDLTVAQTESLEKLTESLEGTDLEAFKSQAETFRDTLVTGAKSKKLDESKDKSNKKLKLQY